MSFSRITAVYFSPTGGTKKAALAFASKLAQQVQEIILPVQDNQEYTFEPEDIVLFTFPVFGGRLPVLATEQLKRFHGNGAAAITATVYGNRAFEDALIELNDVLEAQGFWTAASASFIAEHSMWRELASGRPDDEDHIQMGHFAEKILEKLQQPRGKAVSVPGNHPYKNWAPMPVVPVISDRCVRCGLCASQCPVSAIPAAQPHTTEPAKCILCMRCTAVCPQQARSLPPQAEAMIQGKLSPLKGMRKENELFL